MELVSSARDHLIQTSYGIHKLHHSSHSSISFTDGTLSQPLMGTSCSSANRLAQFLASKCQERSFGGGIRPFGSTIVLCGIDYVAPIVDIDHPTNRHCTSTMTICIVDPSGKVISMSYSPQSEKHTPGLLIIGGRDESVRDRLRHHAQTYVSSNEGSSSNIIRLHLEATLSALGTLVSSEEEPISFQNQVVDEKRSSTKLENRIQSRDIELLLVTAQGGIQRLSEDQVENLLHEILINQS